jgi:hypothetical protein
VVECHLAKVKVASSNLVFRSNNPSVLSGGLFFLTYRKLRKIRAISRSGGMNPPSLSLAGRDEALLESATRRNAFILL